MGAIITRDVIQAGESSNFQGVQFRGGLKTKETTEFQVFDDDGNLYLVGMIDTADLSNFKSEDDDLLYWIHDWAGSELGATDTRINGKSIYS